MLTDRGIFFEAPQPRKAGLVVRLLRFAASAAILVVCAVLTVWAAGALGYDFPIAWMRIPLALVYALAMLVALVAVKPRWLGPAVCIGGFLAVLAGWLALRPSNSRHWQRDVEKTAWAEIDGNRVTLHNFRNFDYTETTFTPRWETKVVDLSQLRGIDLFVNYWGSDLIAHPILSFRFDEDDYVAMSIETRKEVGETYSTLGGFFRQYELIYIAADERDVVRLRTNYRPGEDVYLYRLKVSEEQARERFLDYLAALNRLRDHPRWYNALTTNCTTSIRAQTAVTKRAPLDWRMLANGRMDEMLYEHGVLYNAIPFAELKRRSHVNEAARAADQAPDFSHRIREGLPGFEPVGAAPQRP